MSNWHRFASEADAEPARQADGHIEALAGATLFEQQLAEVHSLQSIVADAAPAIPLFYNPSWGEYNTRYFTGFPSPENPYAPIPQCGSCQPARIDRGKAQMTGIVPTLARRSALPAGLG